ncbi:MAG: cation transporter [Desulfobacteraceae bacterium]|nr:MAG: cation transporter [Desulfobacteraceae bacterium]
MDSLQVSQPFSCPHEHHFLSDRHRENERRTWVVIALTCSTMVVEIVSGFLFGSMALLADGWHMASHASALSITALAFYLARKHKDNGRFTFGTGKIGDLAGFSSALLLVLIALYMCHESVQRFMNPVPIRFNEAILVAVIGLLVNISSALLLKEHHTREHSADDEHHLHHDHNLRAAYLHVIADALTSILAIAALIMGKFLGWAFMDPMMGIVGAVFIIRWSYGLLRDSSRILLDYDRHGGMASRIRHVVEEEGDIGVSDLHVWRLGPGHYSAVVAVRSAKPVTPDALKKSLCHISGLSHVIIEVDVDAQETGKVNFSRMGAEEQRRT